MANYIKLKMFHLIGTNLCVKFEENLTGHVLGHLLGRYGMTIAF